MTVLALFVGLCAVIVNTAAWPVALALLGVCYLLDRRGDR